MSEPTRFGRFRSWLAGRADYQYRFSQDDLVAAWMAGLEAWPHRSPESPDDLETARREAREWAQRFAGRPDGVLFTLAGRLDSSYDVWLDDAPRRTPDTGSDR